MKSAVGKLTLVTIVSLNEPLTMANFTGSQINQNNNKIRLPVSNLGLPFNDYMVLTKQ